ncbi:PaaI family thioesterase [Cupriavidus necator]|uniref:PaaI family thioesterase n=1 Tax=Cupriavidus necator TaxID=106590 RepID=UPI0039C23135
MSTETAADILEIAQRRLMTQPFSALLSAAIVEVGASRCALRVPIRDVLKQQHGFVHGGVISYAADNALTIAGFLAMDRAVVTSEFKVNYVRPAIGEAIIARAECVHAGKSQAVCRCEVYVVTGGAEKLCAVAQGTIALLSGPEVPVN